MKKITFVFIFLAMALALMNFQYKGVAFQNGKKITSQRFAIPDEVQQIISDHCYDCHHSHSKNFKGKMKLRFDQFDHYKKAKLIGKLQDIADVLDEGKMPPKRTVKKYPNMKLTQEESQLIINWANGAMDEVMK